MNLDWQDHATIAGIVVVARLGGFAITNRVLRRNMAWAQKSVGTLLSHAQWAHVAIRAMADSLHLNLISAPALDVATPPPTDVDWKDISGSKNRGAE